MSNINRVRRSHYSRPIPALNGFYRDDIIIGIILYAGTLTFSDQHQYRYKMKKSLHNYFVTYYKECKARVLGGISWSFLEYLLWSIQSVVVVCVRFFYTTGIYELHDAIWNPTENQQECVAQTNRTSNSTADVHTRTALQFNKFDH